MSSAGAAGARTTVEQLRPAIAPIAALLLGLAIIAVAFTPEAVAAYGVWNTSTAYDHCFLILPIALYLAWDRRDRLATTPIIPLPGAALLALPLGVVWFAAERLGIMEGRQLVAVTLLLVLFLAALGWRMWRAMSVPLLYLFFLVPFGAFVTPYLQNFTTKFISVGLTVLGIPAYIDQFTIEIPEGNFVVAEACAGLRFLIASVAFGVLYAFVIYRSTRRRLLFIGASVLIPIAANGLRALGIVVLGHLLGSAEAAATDHVLYGWIFFSIVILALIAVGMAFREDLAAAPASATIAAAPAPPVRRMAVAACLAAILAALGPLAAQALDANIPAAPTLAWPDLAVPEGCSAAAPGPLHVPAQGARAMTQLVTCGDTALTVLIESLPARSNPASLVHAQHDATGQDAAEDAAFASLTVPGIVPATWQVVETANPARVTASVLWIDGHAEQAGLHTRLKQALASVFGAPRTPLLVAIEQHFADPEIPPATRAAAIEAEMRYLAAQHDLARQLDAITTAR